VTLSETRGFVKALVEADSDRILGFTAFGVGAQFFSAQCCRDERYPELRRMR
jgi:pyruvate/2-oxoglutarate dehydrogenase complex dihydrolipoamide dehydrogenase (E3) component